MIPMSSVLPFASLLSMTLRDVVMWPIATVLAGLVIWFIGCRIEDDDGSAIIKWFAGVPLLVGLVLGFGKISKVLGSSPEAMIYRDAIGGRKMLFAHIGAFALPVMAVIALAVWYFMRKRADN